MLWLEWPVRNTYLIPIAVSKRELADYTSVRSLMPKRPLLLYHFSSPSLLSRLSAQRPAQKETHRDRVVNSPAACRVNRPEYWPLHAENVRSDAGCANGGFLTLVLLFIIDRGIDWIRHAGRDSDTCEVGIRMFVCPDRAPCSEATLPVDFPWQRTNRFSMVHQNLVFQQANQLAVNLTLLLLRTPQVIELNSDEMEPIETDCLRDER